MSIFKRLFAVLLVAGSSSCMSAYHLQPAEKRLGTDRGLDRDYHEVATDPQGAGLRMPGFLLGVEKTQVRLIDAPRWDAIEALNSNPDGVSPRITGKFRSVTNDPKRMFLSHLVEYRLALTPTPYIEVDFLHDAYGRDPRRGSAAELELTESAYADSWRALDVLHDRIRTRLDIAVANGEPYTHLVFATMGWHTRQLEGLRDLNSLFGNLLHAAREAEVDSFRPLFVGMTWPSDWTVKVVSYANKANDADELGFGLVNALTHNVLCRLRDSMPMEAPKVVLIGHSFGARIVTRAAFSRAFLRDVRSDRGPDLVLSLQGAFSLNRFIEGGGLEGAPYANHEGQAPTVAMTWSDSDTANPLTRFVTGAVNSGSKGGFKLAQKHQGLFSFGTSTATGELRGVPATVGVPERLMIDASELIRFTPPGTGGGSHSDIFNRYIGRLIWQVFERYE